MLWLLHSSQLLYFLQDSDVILSKLLHAPFLLGEGDILQLLANIVSKHIYIYIYTFFIDISTFNY